MIPPPDDWPEAPGIAGYDDRIRTGTAVGWILELLPRD